VFNYTFSSVRALREWLDEKRWNAGSPEAYDEWLQSLFESGDTVSVDGDEYDYLACVELL
jgi:hypothetical protein